MTLHPFQRFLGLDPELADPRLLLGLSEGKITVIEIEEALRRQLDRIYRHPAGRSDEAEKVRRALREAARQLKKEFGRSGADASTSRPVHSAPRRASSAALQPSLQQSGNGSPIGTQTHRGRSTSGSPDRAASSPALTEFDRRVLAVLVGCGGWNHQSRDYLVALASMYGVSGGGLMRVMRGLSDYARAGGAPLSVEQITEGTPARTAPPLPRGPEPGLVDDLTEVTERLLPELREDSVASRVKLSVIFSLLLILVAVVLGRFMFSSSPSSRGDEPTEPVSQQPDDRTGPGGASSSSDPAADLLDDQRRRSEDATPLVSYETPPTFLGNGLPPEVTDAADRLSQLTSELNELIDQLAATDRLDSELSQRWSDIINTASIGWVRADNASRRAVNEKISEALVTVSDAPSTLDRLLAELAPPDGRLLGPVDLYQGTWKVGMLGKIASDRALPPVVTAASANALSRALEQPASDRLRTFNVAGRLWLNQQVPQLVERTAISESMNDYWELWLAAHRRLAEDDSRDGSEAFNEALLQAVAAIVRTESDLTRAGPMANTLGRLLQTIDYQSSPAVRDGLLDLLRDEKTSESDAWVITSIIARYTDTRWFDRQYVIHTPLDLNDTEALAYRRRTVAQIESAWPEIESEREPVVSSGQGLAADIQHVNRWRRLFEQWEEASQPRGPSEMMEHLYLSARFNETAAVLASQDSARAEALLDWLSDRVNLLAPAAADVREQRESGAGTVAGASSPTSGSQPPGARPSVAPGSQPTPGPGSPPGRRQPSPASTTPMQSQPQPQQPPRAGQPIGPDGQWAAAYEEVIRNRNAKIDLLNDLRNHGTDLGPIDAAVFVHEVYRGMGEEVRRLAQELVVTQFSTGPNVAMQMLDQFTFASRSDAIAETIRLYTGTALPAIKSESWDRAARAALIRHALLYRSDADTAVDVLAAKVADTYRRRLDIESSGAGSLQHVSSADQLVAELHTARMDYAQQLIASTPIPDDPAGLVGRHQVRLSLADGPVEKFVAGQIGVLELLAYVTAAEQPIWQAHVQQVLDESTRARQQSRHILLQAGEAERALARIWNIRLAGYEPDGDL